MIIKELEIRKKFEDLSTVYYGLESQLDSPAFIFHENSKLDIYEARLMGYKIATFSNEFFHLRASQPYKIYPGKKIIDLDLYKNFAKENLEINSKLFDVITERRSIRNYKDDYKLSLNEIFCLLYYAYGISHKTPIIGHESYEWSYRNVPSGGSLYPLELYLVVQNSTINKGIYHFRPDINGIEVLEEGDQYEKLVESIRGEPIVNVKNACCTLIITSVFERTMLKYGNRGYRFILQEVGFVGMNVSLVCQALGLGSCMLGGYLDDVVNEFLDIDGVYESVQNVIVIGKPAENPECDNNNNNIENPI